MTPGEQPVNASENSESGALAMTGGRPASASSTGGQSHDHMYLQGVSIREFLAESRAEKAGLAKGDVIIEFNGVGDLTADKLGKLTAATKPDQIGIPVVFVRDGQEHSVVVPPGLLGITLKDTTIQGSFPLTIAKAKIDLVVQRIQKVYLAIVVLALFGLLAGLIKSSDFVRALWEASFCLLYGLVYFGLRRRREWAIPLVLIMSAYSCIGIFFDLMYPAADLKGLFIKAFSVLCFTFFAYQIVFFSRRDVRRLFRDRGTWVF
jgi:hypothetical protein